MIGDRTPARTARLRLAPHRFALVASLALVAGAASCRRHKSDEELLREKIDCTAVHLYVASKIALFRAPTDPSVQNARAQLIVAVRSATNLARSIHGQPAPQTNTAPPAHLSLADVGRLSLALWELRAEGARVVRSGGDEGVRPVLPALLATQSAAPAWVTGIDVDTEHALFFTVLLALKFDERVPVPIPPEIILYEASRTNPDRVQFRGFETLLHGARAYVFATHELCDLASREASALDRQRSDAAALQRSLSVLSGGRSIRAGSDQSLDVAFRSLGHGASAACYAKRGQEAPMKEELRRFVDSLHALGVPPEETGVIRAFLAHENKDDDGARAALADARRMRGLDEDTRARIEAMDRALASHDRGAVRRQFDRGQLAVLTARVVYRQLERSGVFDELGQTDAIRGVRGYLTATSRTADHATRTLGATAGEAERRARGFFGRFRR
ncbi:MAG: hypothetical protein JNK05_41980 [Myxococcales bacterium]|nr:hypothetical protein [Myxococcales bacterium]